MPDQRRACGLFRFLIFAALLSCAAYPLRAAERAAPNDLFAAALQLPGDARLLTRRIQLSPSTVESSEPLYTGQAVNNSVWIRWTPTYSGVVRVVAISSSFQPFQAVKLDVFEGSSLKTLFPLAANRVGSQLLGDFGVVPFRVLAGHTYYIRLQDTRRGLSFVRYATFYLQQLPISSLGWEERILSQRSSFSVHPALLSPAARELYESLWQTRIVVQPGSFPGPTVNNSGAEPHGVFPGGVSDQGKGNGSPTAHDTDKPRRPGRGPSR